MVLERQALHTTLAAPPVRPPFHPLCFVVQVLHKCCVLLRALCCLSALSVPGCVELAPPPRKPWRADSVLLRRLPVGTDGSRELLCSYALRRH